jgi:hypothetical protein
MLVLSDRRTGEVAFEGKRVSRALPCPICAHLHRTPSWCLIDTTRGLAICPRVESSRKIGDAGYLHRLDGTSPSTDPVVLRPPPPRPAPDLGRLQEQYVQQLTTAGAADLAARWNTIPSTIRRLGTGWDGAAWTFPMRHGSKIVGYRRRTPDGAKLCLTGSRLGLIVPEGGPTGQGSLFVTEGESDLAAAVDLHLDAIARPGCKVCSDLVGQAARRRDVVIVADADGPGIEGAEALRATLLKIARSVVIVRPPGRSKDLREWVRAGGSRDALRFIVKSIRGF